MLLKYPGFARILLLTCCLHVYCSKAQTQHQSLIIPLPGEVGAAEYGNDTLVEQLLRQYPEYFDSILHYRKEYNVQVIYTQVDHGANGLAGFTNHYFNVDTSRYFYPASAIGLPLSLLVLQKLGELKGKGIDLNTTMITETGHSGQTAAYNDPTTADGKPTLANYIKRTLLLNDNDACNHLYEFLGQEYINGQLHAMGYSDIQLLHRLQVSLTEEENRYTNPLKFLDALGTMLYEQPGQYNKQRYEARQDSIGKGFYRGGKLVNEPMNFSKKNRIYLEDIQTMLVSLVYPYKVPAAKRFTISDADKDFILKYMSQYLDETTYPLFDTAKFQYDYSKYLLPGMYKDSALQGVRIFNKSAFGYGHLLDVAYVVDFDKKIEFFLSAVIYCNNDGIFHEDGYDSVGYPFLKHLGELIYGYELKRERKIVPDLSSLIFKYDK